MKRINWKMIFAIVFIVVSTYFGICFMENEFCETMSGVMWLFGEATIVGIIFVGDFINFLKKWSKELMNE